MDLQVINDLNCVIWVENFNFNTVIGENISRFTHVLGSIINLYLILFSANFTDGSKELDFDWHSIERLVECMWFGTESSWLYHNVFSRSLKVKVEGHFSSLIKLEITNRFLRSKRTTVIFQTLFSPCNVITMFEIRENSSVLKWLHGIRQEDQAFSKRESTTLGVRCWSEYNLFNIHS